MLQFTCDNVAQSTELWQKYNLGIDDRLEQMEQTILDFVSCECKKKTQVVIAQRLIPTIIITLMISQNHYTH